MAAPAAAALSPALTISQGRLSRLRLSGGQLSRLSPGIASSGLPLGQLSWLSPGAVSFGFTFGQLSPCGLLFPLALPAASLPLARRCILRPVRWVRLFPMRIGLPASPGFLRPTFPALAGRCVLRRFCLRPTSGPLSFINLSAVPVVNFPGFRPASLPLAAT